MVYNKISNERRRLIIEAYNRGENMKNLSTMFDVKYNTVRKIVTVYQNEGRINKNPKGHRPKKLAINEKEQICDWVDENCTVLTKTLRTKCLEVFGKNVSCSTIDR